MKMRRCLRKRRYRSEKLAAAALAEVTPKHPGVRRYYRCDECEGFHLTSMSKADAA